MRWALLAATGWLVVGTAAGVQAAVINFDDKPGPTDFKDTVALTDAYAARGVRFSGSGSYGGGAILSESGNFGVGAHSGSQFLGFNKVVGATLPELIDFTTPITDFSLFVSGGRDSDEFTFSFFSAQGALLESLDLVGPVAAYAQVAYTAENAPIARVVVAWTTTGDSEGAFVFDDLEYHVVPLPAGLPLLATGLAALGAGWHARRSAMLSRPASR
jgi:hypothetical protein